MNRIEDTLESLGIGTDTEIYEWIEYNLGCKSGKGKSSNSIRRDHKNNAPRKYPISFPGNNGWYNGGYRK